MLVSFKTIRTKTLAALAIAILVVGFAPLASAVESGGIGGRPANPRADNPRTESIFIYTLEGGKQASDAITVINNTSSPKTVSVYPVDSQVSSGGAFSCEQKVDKKDTVGRWIALESDKVELAANDNKNINFTVKVPEGTPAGEYNGCIALQDAKAQAADQGNGIALSMRSAIRVAITVPGEIHKGLYFTRLEIKQTDELIKVNTAVKNNGNVSLDSDVKVLVNTLFGTTAQSAGGQFPVLMGNESEFNFEIDKPFWGGFYNVQAKAEYNSDPTKFVGEGGPEDTIYSDKKLIFVVPSPMALLIEVLVLAAVVGLAAWFILRQRRIRGMKANSTTYTVKQGDTINSIASHNNVNWKDIALINGLKAPYSLSAGDKIKVPPSRRSDRKSKKNTTRD